MMSNKLYSPHIRDEVRNTNPQHRDPDFLSGRLCLPSSVSAKPLIYEDLTWNGFIFTSPRKVIREDPYLLSISLAHLY